MSYLLDTHTFLWWVLDNPKLDRETRALMSETDASLFLSAASAWETVFKLPLHHKDPFDRMLIGQAIVEDMTIITNDELIRQSGRPTPVSPKSPTSRRRKPGPARRKRPSWKPRPANTGGWGGRRGRPSWAPSTN